MLEHVREFGPNHIEHRRVSWPEDLLSVSFDFPESLHHLLAHNKPPSSQESTELNTFKRQTESRYQENEEKIRLLEDELERSKSQKKRLQKQMFACNVAQAPFRHLASDILYYIARSLPRFYRKSIYDAWNNSIHMPMTLSHVSSIWRTTVHRMSTLWQDVRLARRERSSIEFFSEGELHHQKDQVEHFARLSGILPLRIELHNDHRYDINGMADFLDWMADYCAENNKRLQSLHAYNDWNCRIDPAFTRCLALAKGPDRLGLQSCILIYKDDEWNREIGITGILERHPDLRNLWFGYPNDSRGSAKFLSIVSTGIVHVNPAWAKLVTLCVSSLLRHREVANLQWIAKLCPNLESVFVTIDMDFLQSQTTPDAISFKPTIVHHKLKELFLNLSIHDCSVLAPFEDCAFPGVTSFHLQIWSYKMSADSDAAYRNKKSTTLTSAAVFPNLREFTLVPILTSKSEFDPRLLPHLNDVLYTVSDFTIFLEYEHRYVVEFLDFMSKSSLHFPSLRNLHLRVTSLDNGLRPKWPSITEFSAAMQKLKTTRPSISMTLHCLLDISLSGTIHSAMRAYFREADNVFRAAGLGIECRIFHTDWEAIDFDPLKEHFLSLFR
ncbi:hypothetical protein CVT24_005412 [Panaeolus cyanescens]|uniref:Uncharacterized protein n=1 Tax=Panaeolus cyanescens TaxID=181874 RepID=A0A409Y8I5_9AGAR|nr:hypothetical protein CVT24_005412 [Panaeolus cyanescens]